MNATSLCVAIAFCFRFCCCKDLMFSLPPFTASQFLLWCSSCFHISGGFTPLSHSFHAYWMIPSLDLVFPFLARTSQPSQTKAVWFLVCELTFCAWFPRPSVLCRSTQQYHWKAGSALHRVLRDSAEIVLPLVTCRTALLLGSWVHTFPDTELKFCLCWSGLGTVVKPGRVRRVVRTQWFPLWVNRIISLSTWTAPLNWKEVF